MTMFAVVEGDRPPMLLAPLIDDARAFATESQAVGHPQEKLLTLAAYFALDQDVEIEPVGERGILDSGIPLDDVA